MFNYQRKVISFMLAFSLIMTMLPLQVFAKDLNQDQVITKNMIANLTTSSGIIVSPYIGDGFEVEFNVLNQWDENFTGEIKLTNTGTESIKNWSLIFDFNQQITSIWNAQIEGYNDKEYCLKNVGWNQIIESGESVTIGFNATNKGELHVPTKYTLRMKEKYVATNKYAVSSKIIDDWQQGFTGEINITNTGETNIEAWTLEFDYTGEINRFWTAEIISHENNHYVVRPYKYNSNILVGQSLTLGFDGGMHINEEYPINFILKEVNEVINIEVDQEIVEGKYVVDSQLVNLSGTAYSTKGISEVTYTMSSKANSEIVTGIANGKEKWYINDLPVQIGTNYIEIIVKSIDGKIEKKDFIVDRMSTEVKTVDNIYMPEDNEIQEVMDSMKAYWFTEDEEVIAFLMKEDSPWVESIKSQRLQEGDIYFIPPSHIFPMGLVKLIVGNGELSEDDTYNDFNSEIRDLYPLEEYPDELYEIIYTKNLGLTDLFNDDMRIAINQINMEDPIAFSTFDESVEVNIATQSAIKVDFEENNNIMNEVLRSPMRRNRASSTPGFQTQNIAKMFAPKISCNSDNTKCDATLKFLDTVIYDKDGNLESTDDQVTMEGEIGLKDIVPEGQIEWHPTLTDLLPQWIKYELDYTNEAKIHMNYKGNLEMADIRTIKNNFGSFENERMFDYSVLGLDLNAKVSGVDMSNTLILGSIGLKAATLAPVVMTIDGISEQTKRVPLQPIIVIMVGLDLNGELSCEAGITFEYNKSLKKGFEIEKVNSKENVSSGSQWLGANRQLTLIDEEEDSEIKFYIDGKGKAEVKVFPSFKAGLMTAGIMAGMVSAGVSMEANTSLDGKIDILPKLSVEGNAALETKIDLLAIIEARLKANIGETEAKLGGKYDVSYNLFHKKYSFEGIKLEGIVYDGIKADSGNPVFSANKPSSTRYNKPLADVEINVKGIDNKAFDKTVKTDTNGSYKISGLRAGKYLITYSKKGYIIATATKTFTTEDEKIYTTLSRNHYSLQGMVKDQNGNGISDANIKITACEKGGQAPEPILTASDGSYNIETLYAGTYIIEVSKTGYVSSKKNIKVDEDSWCWLGMSSMGKGKIYGKIVEADEDTNLINNKGLAGVTVTLEGVGNISNVKQGAKTNSEGGYYFSELPVGTYKLTISKKDYISVEDYVNVEYTDPIIYNLALELISKKYVGKGTAKGTIVDSVTGNHIGSGFKIYIRKGINNKTGQVLKNINVDSSGKYEFLADAGNYTLQICDERSIPYEKYKYMDGILNVKVLGGKTIVQNGTVTPKLNDSEVRIVLRWGKYPADLDAHLIGPSDLTGNRFHIYYRNKKAYMDGEEIANLDIDDQNGEGPETTTIYQVLNSDTNYSFYVHDYTNRHSGSSTALSKSGAVVEVYTSMSQTPKTFFVPSNSEGTLWKVFEYDAQNKAIIPINIMKNQSDPTNVGYVTSVLRAPTRNRMLSEDIVNDDLCQEEELIFNDIEEYEKVSTK